MNAKAKGSRIERLIKSKFEDAGFKVVRSAGSLGEADLVVEGIGSVQVKGRKSFAVYSLFDSADVLVIKADRKNPLVCIELDKFLELVGGNKDDRA
ncbi:Holliday junction resolvase [Persephonella sp.]